MEAAVLLAKCRKRNGIYGMRTQKMEDGDWWRTWAFPVDENKANEKGYAVTEVHGNLYNTKQYPGCPYCGSVNLVQCDKCKKLSCWNGENHLACPWCGNEMKDLVTSEVSVSGGDL